MKNLYAVLVLVFCSFVSNAQIVNIPDANFKNKLLNYTPIIDTNNDGQIQVSEALVVTELYFSYSSISNMTGIEAFTNLESLNCVNNQLTSLSISNLTNLTSFICANNLLTSLDVSNLINLTYLDCHNNQFTSLDVYNLTNLTYLDCGYNQLTSIDVSNLINLTVLRYEHNLLSSVDVSNLTNLTFLRCENNQLTSLNVSNLTNLTVLTCNENQLTSLDVTNLTNLEDLDCSHNPLTSLDVTNLTNLTDLYCENNQLTSLDVSNLINLTYFNCGYNQLTSLEVSNLTKLHTAYVSNNLFTTLDFSNIIFYGSGSYRYEVFNNPNLISVNIKNGAPFYYTSSFQATNCPNLLYICADEFNFQYIYVPNAQLNSYCSFNPGGNYNTITGTFSLDNNNNGCDANDYHFSDSKIKINDVSNIFGATYTNTSGNYNFFTQAGNFTITPKFENPYFTVSPTSATITFADSNNNTQTQNFCVTPNGVHNDVEVSVLPIQRARPGFDATYQMVYKNKGNQVLSGNVNLTFNDAVLDFVVANPAVSAQSLNTLSWSYANLLPFESRTIYFTLNVNSPQEIPAVNIGDILSLSASIDPISGDETVNDNTFALTQTVLGSYDPNDKTCLEGDTIVPERIGEYLHYLIRFQNSGTAAAENIVVKDIIDTTKFDITSLQLTSASHNYTTKITGNKVEFIFENINLPAEIDNEAASHGFVAFKIKTKNNLTIGNSVSNKADIYFDYNFPITTNEATTTFATLGVNQIENKSVVVFPNPVQDILTITSKGNLTSIQLLDVQGRLIATYLENEEKATINLSDKASGVYFVKIFTENGVKLEKIVKK